MQQEKFSRNAAITSQVIIILWLAVQLLTSIFKKSLLVYFFRNEEEVPKVNSWAVIVLCVGGLCVIAANFMICRKKGKNAPLLMSAIALGLLPIAVQLFQVLQLNSLNNRSGTHKFAAVAVYNSNIVKPLSCLLYAGAAVTIAAAAVYAFGDSETFPRKTSIASQIVLIVWIALQLLSGVFQKNALKLFVADEQVIDEVGKITSYAAFVFCFGGLLILIANVLICRKKGRLSPLLVSSITTDLLPIIASRVMWLQNVLAGFESADAAYVVGAYNSLVSMLSYLFYVGAVLAIAAAAVYIFVNVKAVPDKSTEVHDFK